MRRALPKRLKDYSAPWRVPKCKGCGGRKYRLDRWQQKKNAASKCQCSGYHHLHRKGSKWCNHAIATVTYKDMADRYGGEPLDYHFVDDPRIRHTSTNRRKINAALGDEEIPF